MKLKRFVGSELSEVVAAVRRELGRDAVVVQTRRVAANGWRRWLRTYDQVEVVAAVEEGGGQARAPRRPAAPAASAGRSPVAPEPATAADQSRQLAELREQLLAARGERRQAPPPPPVTADEQTRQIAALRERLLAAARPVPAAALPAPAPATGDAPAPAAEVRAEPVRPAAPAPAARAVEVPVDGQGIEALRRRVVAAPVRLGAPLAITPRPGEMVVAALVGPTGAGKTTTVAKLAAHLCFDHGWRVGLVTADTFRVGAVEQLGAYARLLGVPCEVAPTPKALERSLARLTGCDVVLVDTSGRGHRDGPRMEELGCFLDAARSCCGAGVVEVHLVLPATQRQAEARAVLEAYSRLGATRLLLTKLDECEARQEALEMAAAGEIPLSYYTAGQRVPEDLAVAWPDGLAAWALGEPLPVPRSGAKGKTEGTRPAAGRRGAAAGSRGAREGGSGVANDRAVVAG